MRVLAALDKFRGTLTAPEATSAVAAACWELGVDCDEAPLSDGGEGLLDVFGGGNRTSVVSGPLGMPVEAAWRIDRRTAVIEMARASGLALAGGAGGNDPLAATTRGTGELIAKAIEQGARTVLVGLGGSATTDGGLGAIEALGSPARLGPVALQVACDVRTRFVDAAAVFAPQKGATPAQVRLLRARLERLAERYVADYDVDVRDVDGTGAAGGLAGGLLAVGAQSAPRLRTRRRARRPRRTSRRRRRRRHRRGLPRRPEPRRQGRRRGLRPRCRRRRARRGDRRRLRSGRSAKPSTGQAFVAVSLVERFGDQRAFTEPRWCIEQAMRQALATMRSSQPAVVVVAPPAGVGACTLGAAEP